MMRRAPLLLLALFAARPAAAAETAVVVGEVRLSSPRDEAGSVDLYGKYRGTRPPGDDAASAVAVVALMPRGEHPAPPSDERPVMDQKGLAFRPRVLAVRAGGVVRFTNSDDVFHNVFSLSAAKKFDLGRYARGGSESVTFDRPGTINVFCDIHPEMRAFIVVVGSPWFAVTDAGGRYRIEDVPHGTYDLLVWRDDYAKPAPVGSVRVDDEGVVTVTAGGDRN